MNLRVAPIDPTDARLAALIAAHAAHGDAHYPAESNHHLTGPEMAARGVALVGAWLGDDLVGMGGVAVWAPGKGEVKSMHVSDTARGQGAGAAILAGLFEVARGQRLDTLWLETGSRDGSAAARRLYEKAGFTYCPPFGDFVEDPESVFMRCEL